VNSTCTVLFVFHHTAEAAMQAERAKSAVIPVSFHQSCITHSADDVTLSNSPSTCSPLSSSITHSLFYSRLKTHLFHKSFSAIVC